MNMRCFNRQLTLASQPLCPLPLPPRGETHVWYVVPDEVKSSSLMSRYFDMLSSCEKQNVLSFQENEPRKRALLARALVRTTISRYQTNTYIDPRSIKFKKNFYGKPEVDWQHLPDENIPPLQFNLSHTSSLIACGITAYSPIGIDVEEKKRTIKNDILSFARRFFSPLEVEHLANNIDPEIQRQEFLKLWTLKEAYVKALGRGFSATPFKTFRIHYKAASRKLSNIPESFDPEESEIVVESTQPANRQWKFALLELDDTHYTAICTEDDSINSRENPSPMALRVWKTIPLVEDLCMSRSPSIVTVGGLVNQLK